MIPTNISKENILEAFSFIDEEGIKNGAQSSTYDVIFNDKRYPPKLVISLANKFANGYELDRSSFKGGEKTKAFEILRNHGFLIERKPFIKDLVYQFLEQAKTDSLTTSQYPNSYRGLKIKVSFGVGNQAKIPWIAFLKPPNKVMDGIYPGVLYYKEENLLILTYGRSETNSSSFRWGVEDAETINEYFQKNLNKKPRRYGESLMKSAFDLDHSLDIEKFESDLDELIDTYKNLSFENLVNEPEEKYNSTNYWIFQCNPAIFDLESALKADAVHSWKVAAHKDKIQPGDKAIIWVTGSDAKCLALGEIRSEPSLMYENNEERKYYYRDDKPSQETRVRIVITDNFLENPIYWSDIKLLPEFKDFKAGNQGTNFSADKEEFDALKEFGNAGQVGIYEQIKRKLDSIKVEKYLKILKEFKYKNQLDQNDERISFNVRPERNRLVFIIGNRYSFLIHKENGETQFEFISNKKLNDNSGSFYNYHGEERMFFNKVKDINGFENDILLGLQTELDKNRKTPYRKFLNQDFMKDVFETKSHSLNERKDVALPLNSILYGPPGTGKTFKLQNEYFDDFTVRESSLTRTQYLENLVSELTWWQVIAIVLLDIKKSKVNDIHSHELLIIKEKLSNSKRVRPIIWGNLQHFTDPECEYVNVAERSPNPIFFKDKESFWEVKEDLLEQFYPEAFSILEEVKNYHPNPDKLIKNYEFVTFHQSFSYEDFIEGIKPKLEDQENEVSYEIQDGIFKKLCLKADADRGNDYAIFIDEINRGNVSAIFGELITLIEKDKRLGEENELRAKLPYSKNELGVPPNLYIFGTMNTADRSVEALDTALRRRFVFEEVMPIPDLLKNIEFDGFNLSQVLITINERIEALLDRDHAIGHSYFIKINSGDTEALKLAFENKIIPLLQEYFYHDYEKIALILGEGFIEQDDARVKFARFNNVEEPELTSSFKLKPVEDIEAAINALLNNVDEEN
ncbi:EVE domain-containing protein [Gramella jeungdoensis]|uniref:EVE domain-containing protein n=1 Tax=Gramella jeungdoensis TaxID=708091 RepID=A0ABT0YZK8_9FLAO|nr:AAA family ATPase [Gramella jeungdoensis]MCM8568908.1 EVE domain-containing protein [Gramella jeungdoensis]